MTLPDDRLVASIKKTLAEFAKKNLEGIILPYWLDNAIDKKNGGIIGEINSANKSIDDAPKGLIPNSRVLWTFSACYKLLKDERLKVVARETYEYIIERFHDKENGGYFWLISAEGDPLDTKKQTYAQAFTLYGFSEYYSISSDPEVLQKAIDIFYLMESKCNDKTHGGYHEAFTRNWTEIGDMRLSAKDLNADKTMNTHLHILEAYTNLFRIWKDKSLGSSLRELLGIFDRYFVNHDDHHLNLFYDTQWNLLSGQISYGHDIEASWLMHESAEILEDSDLIKKYGTIAVKMANASMEGMTDRGALIYEWHRGGKGEKDEGIEWWPQAEAIVGFLNAFELSGEISYLETASKISEFISEFIVNKKHGEWHNRVSKEGVPDLSLPIIGFWKCPYHNARMCLEIIRRTDIRV
jgi:cellobiose epimerase